MLFRNCAIYTMLLSFSTQVVLAAYPPIGNTAAGPSNAAETFAQPSSDDFQDIRDVIEMYSEVCLTNNAPQAITGSTSATAPTDANSHAPSGLRKYCDPRFMLSLLDPRDTILPFTGKKAAFWLTLASLVAGLVVLEQYYPYSGYIAEGIRYNNTILLSILYGMEPLMIAFFLIAAQYPAANPIPNQTSGDIEAQISGSQTEDTALVIPCHNSQEKIVKTLEAALKHFRPEQIYIVDNGNTTAPTDQTQKIVKNIHPNINYIWLPIGNKNIAQFTGSMAAKNYKNILTTDDDVALPTNFKAPLQLFNDNVKAATFAIEAIDTKGKKPIFVGWQDIEYKFSDLSKLVESRFGGVMYPHGASSFWDRETFIEVLRRHDTVYYAEDVKLGLVLQKTGKRMAMDAGVSLATEVPESLFGPPLNFYQQRVRSWEMGRHSIYGQFVSNLFSLNGQNTVSGFVVQKSFQFYAVLSNTADWIRVPLFVVMGVNPQFWIKVAGFTAAPIIPLLIFKYTKAEKRPDLDIGLGAIFTFPIYKSISTITSILGAIRTLCVYWPNYTHKPNIPELERNNDPRCIWLQAETTEPQVAIESNMGSN